MDGRRLLLGMSVGGVWEIVDFTSDGALDTALPESNADTVGDLVADAVGSLPGAGLLVAWTVWGWGSVRRITGVNTYEQVSPGAGLPHRSGSGSRTCF